MEVKGYVFSYIHYAEVINIVEYNIERVALMSKVKFSHQFVVEYIKLRTTIRRLWNTDQGLHFLVYPLGRRDYNLRIQSGKGVVQAKGYRLLYNCCRAILIFKLTDTIRRGGIEVKGCMFLNINFGGKIKHDENNWERVV